MRPETLAVHAGAEPDQATGAIAPPLHLSTTFKHGPAGERVAGYEYQREANPTQDRLEAALTALEGGEAALAFGSRLAKSPQNTPTSEAPLSKGRFSGSAGIGPEAKPTIR